MQSLLPIHIAAGGLAIMLGGAALIAAKGGWLHRKSGLLFVYAMITMGLSGAVLGVRQGNYGNVSAGLICAYFVITALTTVRPVTARSQRLTFGAATLAFTAGASTLASGVRAAMRPHMTLGGVPAPMFFFLGTILLLAFAGDVRAIRTGPLRGAQRLRRHLWRMCFALFIAAGSFFSIRARVAKVLPEPFTTPAMRILPIVLIFAAMYYWLWRVRPRRAERGLGGPLASALTR